MTLSVHNATNHRNPYFYYLNAEYETREAANGKTYKVPKRIKASPVYLFPILPSLTWNFKFG